MGSTSANADKWLALKILPRARMTELDDETVEEIYQAYELIPDVDHAEEVSVKDMILNLCFTYPDILTQV